MEIGSLTKRITFETVTEGENELGQTVLEPTKFKTVWAQIQPVRGREYYELKKTQNENNYKIITRYHSGITADMKIKYKDKIFEIQNIINPLEANKSLEFMCIEKVKKDCQI